MSIAIAPTASRRPIMAMTSIRFKVEFEECNYIADADVHWHADYNYGADADGNRGIYKRFIDDVTINSVEGENGRIAPSDALIELINEMAGDLI